MSKNFDRISKIDIKLASPVIQDTTFGCVLILGEAPEAPQNGGPAPYAAYKSIDDVENAGWVTEGDGEEKTGVAARIAFSQNPKPDKIYIAVLQKDETLEAAVQRVLKETDWYVLCAVSDDNVDHEDISAIIEDTDRLFAYADYSAFIDDTGGTSDDEMTPHVSADRYRTFGIFCRTENTSASESKPLENMFLHIAFAVKWLSNAPGSETAAFKELNGVLPSDLTELEMERLTEVNLNYFVSVGGKNVTMNGKVMAGEWMDVIRFRDWLKSNIQDKVANLFINTPKIPFNDAGISLVQNQVIAALKEGQAAGGIPEDEFDQNGNLIPAFTTSVPKVSSISYEDRVARRLPGCKFKARISGAIHFAEVDGSLTYDM